MGLAPERPAAYEDLFDLPGNVVGEIINGRLVTRPRPAPKHARAYSSLGGELGGPFDLGRNGFVHAWLVAPDQRTLEVFKKNREGKYAAAHRTGERCRRVSAAVRCDHVSAEQPLGRLTGAA